MRRTVSLVISLAVAASGLAVGAAGALANTITSANWSGYVAHRGGLSFRSISAVWRQPSARCGAAAPAYSATWVGLGGFSRGATRLEQIGTELDCTALGAPVSTAWYELVPGPSVTIPLRVNQGDLVSARVTVVGGRVILRLTDHTRHRSFAKRLRPRRVDVSSADWIVESPSACWIDGSCQTLPLADFVAVHMANARAQAADGRTGTISSGLWRDTAITLSAASRVFVGGGSSPSRATPSALRDAGSAFDVVYSRTRGRRTARAPSLEATSAAGDANAGTNPGGVIR
jgi:hypothetical protein